MHKYKLISKTTNRLPNHCSVCRTWIQNTEPSFRFDNLERMDQILNQAEEWKLKIAFQIDLRWYFEAARWEIIKFYLQRLPNAYIRHSKLFGIFTQPCPIYKTPGLLGVVGFLFKSVIKCIQKYWLSVTQQLKLWNHNSRIHSIDQITRIDSLLVAMSITQFHNKLLFLRFPWYHQYFNRENGILVESTVYCEYNHLLN